MADVVVTKVQDGRVLPVTVGDSIDDTLLEVGGLAYHGEDAGLGSRGVKAWTLRSPAPGRTRVALKRWRHWEGDQSIVERFAITLDVKPG
jgi:predicted secreted protein